ncbi:xylulose kinase, partial [Actinoallomurus acaciae]
MGHCERAVCAVDVGTSAVRAALVTPEGKTLRLARRPRDGDVAHTFDAEVLWRDLVAVLRDLHGAAEVTAPAMAGHVVAVAVGAGGA